LQALRARRLTPLWQCQAQSYVIWIRVACGGRIRNRIAEAVVSRRILQTSGAVDRFVRHQACICLNDKWIPLLEVSAAVVGADEILGDGLEEWGAEDDRCVTGGVKGLGEQGDIALGAEEGVAIL
jgi:hypothetical protein